VYKQDVAAAGGKRPLYLVSQLRGQVSQALQQGMQNVGRVLLVGPLCACELQRNPITRHAFALQPRTCAAGVCW
jgi:hypothetical protein